MRQVRFLFHRLALSESSLEQTHSLTEVAGVRQLHDCSICLSKYMDDLVLLPLNALPPPPPSTVLTDYELAVAEPPFHRRPPDSTSGLRLHRRAPDSPGKSAPCSFFFYPSIPFMILRVIGRPAAYSCDPRQSNHNNSCRFPFLPTLNCTFRLTNCVCIQPRQLSPHCRTKLYSRPCAFARAFV